MDGIFILLTLLALFVGVVTLLGFVMSKADQALKRAVRNQQMERQMRKVVADAEAQQRIARKLLRERGQ